jgi:hypothetical protein
MIPEYCTAGKDIPQKIGHIFAEIRRRQALVPIGGLAPGPDFRSMAHPPNVGFLSPGIQSANRGRLAANSNCVLA